MTRFCLLFLLLALGSAAHAQDTWELSLNDVTVERARESGGDRPYFAVLTFQAQALNRRATRVELYEREPHDWVSKPEYRGSTRLRLGAHMSQGETLPVPDWMGRHLFDPVTTVPAGASSLEQASAPIYGLLIVALDNNNTPPHAIRETLSVVRDWFERFLDEQIGRGQIASTIQDGRINEDTLESAFRDFIGEAFSDLDKGLVLKTAVDYAVGSWGNPDHLVGLHALVFPAIADADEIRQTTFIDVPVLATDTVGVSFRVGPPTALTREPLIFEGSGARYQLRVSLTSARPTADLHVGGLTLRIRTGDDDLREGSHIRATAYDRRGVSLGSTDLNGGQRWADRQEHTVRLPFRSPVLLADVGRVDLAFTSGPGLSGDGWKVDMISVFENPATSALWSRQGRPLHEFSGDRPSYSITLPVPPVRTAERPRDAPPASPRPTPFPPSDRTTLELNQDRPGRDYRHFTVSSGNYRTGCQRVCEQDSQCHAWTYVKTSQVCWLKNAVPGQVRNTDTISGMRMSLVRLGN